MFTSHDDLDASLVGAEDALARLADRFDLDDEHTAELKGLLVDYATPVAAELDIGSARTAAALLVLEAWFAALAGAVVEASQARELIAAGARRVPIPRHRAAIVGTAAVAVIAPLSILYSANSAGAAGTPPETGCAAGFQTLSVSWLESQGPYQVPARLDDPANGGNGDQLVCGKPINATRTAKLCGTPCDVPVLYEFADNNLTPWH